MLIKKQRTGRRRPGGRACTASEMPIGADRRICMRRGKTSKDMLLLGVLLLGVTATSAMFYTECVKDATSFPVVCCPSYRGSPCGSAMNRGNCVAVQSSRAVSDPDIHTDDRVAFPSAYYYYMCKCNGNFTGANCGECIHNHYGENCDQVNYIERKEIRQMTEVERHRYFAQLNLCKLKIDPEHMIMVSGDRFRTKAIEFRYASYYDVVCYYHNYVTRLLINNTRENTFLNFGHGSTGFLTLHRLFMMMFERAMQKCTKDPNFAASYYDWSNDNECAICNDEFLGGNNQHGQISQFSAFSSWRTICSDYSMSGTLCMMSNCECERPPFLRKPGATPGVGMPTRTDVLYCLNLTSLDVAPYTSSSVRSYRNCAEGFRNRFENPATAMHNLFHVFCGGTMGIVSIAASDPLFYFHHMYMDKLFNLYIQKWNLNENSYPVNNNIYGHRAYDCILPALPCVQHRQMCVPIRKFGVIYSSYNGM